MDYRKRIASELSLDPDRVALVMELMAGGATIPFIARYRKEVSGGMDEVVLSKLRDLSQTLEAVEKRRSAILSSLEERELLTGELNDRLNTAGSLTELEDIYLPFSQNGAPGNNGR